MPFSKWPTKKFTYFSYLNTNKCYTFFSNERKTKKKHKKHWNKTTQTTKSRGSDKDMALCNGSERLFLFISCFCRKNQFVDSEIEGSDFSKNKRNLFLKIKQKNLSMREKILFCKKERKVKWKKRQAFFTKHAQGSILTRTAISITLLMTTIYNFGQLESLRGTQQSLYQ